MTSVHEWTALVVGEEFGATELLALGVGGGMLLMLLVRRPSRTSVFYFLGMMSIFAAFLLVLRSYYERIYLGYLMGPVHWIVGWLLNLAGYHVAVTPVSLATETYAINLAPGCSGASFIAVFALAIAIYPASWRARAWGLATGLALVLVLNLVRFGTLLWIGSHYPEAMHVAKEIHAYIFVLILVALYWGWLAALARGTRGLPPSPDSPASPDATSVSAPA